MARPLIPCPSSLSSLSLSLLSSFSDLFVRCNDMWLAKDNRFLNPMSTYERNLMAPTCLIINNYYGATDILCFPFHHHCLAQPLIDSVDVWFPSSQSNNHMLALIINCGTKVSVMTSLLALMITSSSLLLSIGSIILESWNPCLYPRNSHHCLCSSSVFHCLNLVSSPCSLSFYPNFTLLSYLFPSTFFFSLLFLGFLFSFLMLISLLFPFIFFILSFRSVLFSLKFFSNLLPPSLYSLLTVFPSLL